MGLKTGPKWAPFWARCGALMPPSSTPAIKGLASDLGGLVSQNGILQFPTTRPETGLKADFRALTVLRTPEGPMAGPGGKLRGQIGRGRPSQGQENKYRRVLIMIYFS